MADLGVDVSLKIVLSEIEKKVGQAEVDRDNFKTNLSKKGVDVTGLNKMSELIGSIPNISVKRWASGVTNFSKSYLSVNNLTFKPSIILTGAGYVNFYSDFFSETNSYMLRYDGTGGWKHHVNFTESEGLYSFSIYCSAGSSTGTCEWMAIE